VKKGGVLEAGIEAGEFIHNALTFRSGTQRLYTIISVGYNYTDNFFTVGTGLGTSFNLIGKLGLNLELTYADLYSNRDILSYLYIWNSLTQFRPVLNYRFAKHFKIYAGPSLNILAQRDNGTLNPDLGIYNINIPYSIYQKLYRRSKLDMWVGFVGGIKF